MSVSNVKSETTSGKINIALVDLATVIVNHFSYNFLIIITYFRGFTFEIGIIERIVYFDCSNTKMVKSSNI